MILAILMVIIFSVAFAATHIGLEIDAVKSKIVAKVGEKGFKGIYVLISLVTLGGAIYFLRGHTNDGVLLWRPSWVKTALGFPILVAGISLVIFGMIQPSPTGMVQLSYEPKGIQFITRHPVNMGIAFFAFAHMLFNPRLASAVFFGSLFVTGFFGAYHQDARKTKALGEKFASFAARTSVIPFGALATGKAKISDIDLSKPVLVGCGIVIIVIMALHKTLFGVPLF